MYAITGITGKVGGAMARALLARNQPVRAVVRDAAKGAEWAALGCEVVVSDMSDATALAAAFAGTQAVFILPPPNFDPAPGYPEARRVINAVASALADVRPQPKRVLCLSTIGADAVRDNLLSQRTMMEEALSTLPMPVTFLRPGWFIENAALDVASARERGVIESFLAPLDKPVAMVATRDVGETAARLIQETWDGIRIVPLEGPRRVSPDDLAAAFAAAQGKPVRAVIVPRGDWETLFRAQGMKHPMPRMRMIDGFNEGWIAFADDGVAPIKGTVDVREVIACLVAARPSPGR